MNTAFETVYTVTDYNDGPREGIAGFGDDDRITRVLRAGRDSTGFWQKIGFTASKVAMEMPRRVESGHGEQNPDFR